MSVVPPRALRDRVQRDPAISLSRRPTSPATPPAPSDAPPVVLPDVQKSFWLRGDLAARLGAELAARRGRQQAGAARISERDLLNEAVELLVARSSSK